MKLQLLRGKVLYFTAEAPCIHTKVTATPQPDLLSWQEPNSLHRVKLETCSSPLSKINVYLVADHITLKIELEKHPVLYKNYDTTAVHNHVN